MAPMNGGYERYRDSPYLIGSTASCGTARQCLFGQWFPLFHAPLPPPGLSSHPSLLRSLSFFLSFPLFLSLCRPTSRRRSVGSESLYCARYVGVSDHSLARGVRLDYCESDRLPFSLTRRGGGPQISVSKFASFRVFNLSIGREKEGKNGDE